MTQTSPPLHRQSLEEQSDSILQECRMVLPGVQAVLGFQLIAVFQPTFEQELDALDRALHVASMAAFALAVICLMLPAAFHRLAEPGLVTPRFVEMGSTVIAIGLGSLALGLALDVYLVTHVALHALAPSITLGILVALVGALAWFVLPLAMRRR